MEQVKAWLEVAVFAVEVFAVGIALLGIVYAAWEARHRGERYKRFKNNVARSVLLALELLIVADIVDTIVIEPTLDRLVGLALLTAIRFGISWEVSRELKD